MSYNESIIKVTPPSASSFSEKEHILIKGFVCPVCNGRSSFNVFNPAYHGSLVELEKKRCDMCYGTGGLRATVTIEWQPEVNNEK